MVWGRHKVREEASVGPLPAKPERARERSKRPISLAFTAYTPHIAEPHFTKLLKAYSATIHYVAKSDMFLYTVVFNHVSSKDKWP